MGGVQHKRTLLSTNHQEASTKKGPAEQAGEKLAGTCQEVLEMNRILVSCFAQPLKKTNKYHQEIKKITSDIPFTPK